METILESLVNALQIAILSICCIFTLVKMLSIRGKSWILLFFFYGSFLLGDLYWQVCLIFYGDKPQIAVVSDLSWYAAYLFLFLLLRTAWESEKTDSFIPYLALIFTAGMAAFYIREGNIISNIIYAALMGLLLFTVVNGLLHKNEGEEHFSPLYLTVLIFCFFEYAMWTASCFWERAVFRHAYYVFDLLLTLCFPCFITMLSISDKKKSGSEVRS